MKKVLFVSLALAGTLFVPAITRAQFAGSVVSYTQGSGVTAGYNDPTVALGAPSQFTPGDFGGPVDPFNAPYLPSQIVGLGTGGSITLQFNTPIQNIAANPYGLDFIIFGHAGFYEDFGNGTALDGSLYTGGTSDVRLSVSADGSTFYTLNPSQTPVVDGLFPTDGNGNPLIPVNPSLTANDFSGQTLSGIESLYAGSAGGAGFNLDWAVDGNNRSVSLPSVNFVRLENFSDVAYIDAVSVVPEPATVALATAGASLLWLQRRKKTTGGANGIHPVKLCLLFLSGLVAASICGAATFTEDFSANPRQNGWEIFGDTNLFRWDSTNQNLAVTWDSSQTNSYFYRPFGTILAKSDDFGISFDLQLADIAIGVNPAKTNTFELAVGFINYISATSTNLQRGTGVSANGARNTFEFDYFPDSGKGATIAPTIISSNNQFATKFAFPFTLDPGALFHVSMNYTASNKTLRTTMTRNGVAFASIPNVVPGSTFKDFRLDQTAIINWSDAGADGSLLAHGTVDNFVVTVPPPPIQNLTGAFSNNVWQAQFISQSNWFYTLERTGDFQSWTDVSPATSGNGTNLFLPDTNAPADNTFYRVRAERP